MRCEEARAHLSAFIDGELTNGQREAVATHVAGCPACAALADDYRKLGPALRAAAYERAPPDLMTRISARLAEEIAEAPAQVLTDARIAQLPIARPPVWRSVLRQAAVLLVACGLSAAAAWHLTQRSGEQASLARDAVAAHVRSLLQDSTVQVASSDRHTVKPWFTGRLDFSPNVKDVSAEGFALVGGRLDYLAEQRVAVLVYKRRQHLINVFMWPNKDAAAAGTVAIPGAGVQSLALKGYNGLRWNTDGIEHWAVSDLNRQELEQLQKLL